MTAFDHKRGLHYDCDISSDGSFVMGVDDYPQNTSFYLQAFNRKCKSDQFSIQLTEDVIPDIYLLQWKWETIEATKYQGRSQLDTTDIHWIPELTIKAKYKPKTSTLLTSIK